MKSPKTTSVLTCKISRAIFVFQSHKCCHHFSWALFQKNRCNIQKAGVVHTWQSTEQRVCGMQYWCFPHTCWVLQNWVAPSAFIEPEKLQFNHGGRTPKRLRASLAYPSSPRIANTWHMCSAFLPNPLKGPRNQQSAVCATWAEHPPKCLHMVHKTATICWLDWSCGRETHFPFLSNLRSVSSRFIPSHVMLSVPSLHCHFICAFPTEGAWELTCDPQARKIPLEGERAEQQAPKWAPQTWHG